MDDKLVKILQKRAAGYHESEVTSEYNVDEEGNKKLVRVKEISKFYPPEQHILRLLFEMEGDNKDTLSRMTDAELQAEKKRLIGCLRELQEA